MNGFYYIASIGLYIIIGSGFVYWLWNNKHSNWKRDYKVYPVIGILASICSFITWPLFAVMFSMAGILLGVVWILSLIFDEHTD